MYLQYESEDHLPNTLIKWSSTLEVAAVVAAPILKECPLYLLESIPTHWSTCLSTVMKDDLFRAVPLYRKSGSCDDGFIVNLAFIYLPHTV